MDTNELFESIQSRSDFKDYPNSRVLKFRHKKGTLTVETYEALFAFYGYKKNLNWILK